MLTPATWPWDNRLSQFHYCCSTKTSNKEGFIPECRVVKQNPELHSKIVVLETYLILSSTFQVPSIEKHKKQLRSRKRLRSGYTTKVAHLMEFLRVAMPSNTDCPYALSHSQKQGLKAVRTGQSANTGAQMHSAVTKDILLKSFPLQNLILQMLPV